MTGNQIEVLLLCADGKPWYGSGLNGNLTSGRRNTLGSLRLRGLLDADWKLTEKGQRVVVSVLALRREAARVMDEQELKVIRGFGSL